MEKNRWSLMFIGLCLALVFSVSSVEAQIVQCVAGGIPFPWEEISNPRCDRDEDCYVRNNNRCIRENSGDPSDNDPPPAKIDCDDSDPLVIGPPPCDDDDDPQTPGDPPAGAPIIAMVANRFNLGTATGEITSLHLGGIYTNVRVNQFNNWTAAELREKFDVLHMPWSGPSSMRVSWVDKLLAFMLLGGGILHEDPQNVLEIFELAGVEVEHHVEGDDPAVVVFETAPPPVPPLDCAEGGDEAGFPECYVDPEEILSAFVPGQLGGGMNGSGYFMPVPFSDCLNAMHNPSSDVQTLGLGYGCLANNHMTFNASQTDPAVTTLGALTPFLKLEGITSEAVGLYGEYTNGSPETTGRILFTGPDSGLHASFVASPFQANHFCLLTNELIWVSQLPVTDGSAAKLAMDNCVANAETYRDQYLGED